MTWSKEPGRRRGQPLAQRLRIIAKHHGICHLCGHRGAEQVDHIVSVKAWLRQGLEGSPHRDSNLAPAHDQPCATCGRRCHVDKTQQEAAQARAANPSPSRSRAEERHPGQL